MMPTINIKADTPMYNMVLSVYLSGTSTGNLPLGPLRRHFYRRMYDSNTEEIISEIISGYY